MAPPTKKNIHHGGVLCKAWEVIESDKDDYEIYDDDETIFTKAAKLLGDRDLLAIE
jgi:hypothetical protein